jgi:uncharacterized membrane protein YphA (DoxX/SURF4 family)
LGSIKKFFFFIARICMSAIFLIAGFAHISDFDGFESSLTNALYSISEHSGGSVWIQTSVEKVMPFVPVLSIVTLFILVIGGISVFLGIKYRLGAILLIIFLAPVTFIVHHFYFLEGAERQMQATMFWKNLAILGGLIVLASYPQYSKVEHDEEV